MVNRELGRHNRRRDAFSPSRQLGALTTDLVVAMSIIVIALIPLAFSFAQEQKLCRAYYYKAVAMEIIDGEMEVLQAGEWRTLKEGTQPYPVRAEAVKNLPSGNFLLTMEHNRIRLEWLPDNKYKSSKVVREMTVK